MQEFSGTYNCVLTLPKSNEVIRVASLRDTEEGDIIERGANIVHFLQRYRGLLGPSLIRETRPPQIQSAFPFKVACAQVKKSGPPYLVQGLEYCNGKAANSNYKKTAFCLIWFFFTGGKKFQLRHGDLKDGNVVFRKATSSDERVSFQLDENHFYSFKLSQDVPVVIDFDFASVLTTDEKLYQVGSAHAAAPEAIIARIFNETETTHRYVIPLYRDWWSVGIVLWDFWMGKDRYPSDTLFTMQERFVRDAWKHFMGRKENVKEYWPDQGFKAIFRYAWIQKRLGQSPIADFWQPIFSKELLEVLIHIPVDEKDPLPLTDWQVTLLKRLLSWNPVDRHYGDEEQRLITEHFQDLKTKKLKTKSPTYRFQEGVDFFEMYDIPQLKESLHHLHQSQTY